jgi:hypothetical protein
MDHLSIRCPETNKSINTGVGARYESLTRVWNDEMRVPCPHCGQNHMVTLTWTKRSPISEIKSLKACPFREMKQRARMKSLRNARTGKSSWQSAACARRHSATASFLTRARRSWRAQRRPGSVGGIGHRSRAQHHLKNNDRSSRFFRCREKYGSPSELLAMGDLSRRQE